MSTEQDHIGYKKVHVITKHGKRVEAICKLRITGEHNEARTNVCNPQYAKYRCSEAFVLSIHRRTPSGYRYKVKTAYSMRSDFLFKYLSNSIVKPSNGYDTRIEKVCSGGIHYFKTKKAAQEYSIVYSLHRKDCGGEVNQCEHRI